MLGEIATLRFVPLPMTGKVRPLFSAQDSRRPRVLCLADLTVSPKTREMLEAATDLVTLPPGDREGLLRLAPECEAYLASLWVRFDKEVFDRAKRLRIIATPSTGTDHLDLEEAARRGIPVISLKDETEFLDRIPSTAELAWGLLLSAVRRIPAASAASREGRWARDEFRGRQIAYKTLGILGYGRLGRIVAGYGTAFRMRVIACDVKPFSSPAVERVDFDTLLTESDALSIHVHLTDETRGMLDKAAFRKMKPGVVIINTSRGAIIDEAALLEALKTGKVAAAGLDVIVGEWRRDLDRHPVIRYARDHDNLIVTPHVGGITWEAQDTALQFTAQKLLRALREEFPEHAAEGKA